MVGKDPPCNVPINLLAGTIQTDNAGPLISHAVNHVSRRSSTVSLRASPARSCRYFGADDPLHSFEVSQRGRLTAEQFTLVAAFCRRCQSPSLPHLPLSEPEVGVKNGLANEPRRQ